MMNKKHLYLLILFVSLVGGYCIGKYNNCQRYTFHHESYQILDTYTGDVYFKGKKVNYVNK